MPRLSFRTKLIAAMALVVGGVTATTVWLTQRRVQASYQHMFEEQFATQLKFFSESRLSQLDESARRCETVAETESVVEALKSGDADKCYAAVLAALRELYKPQEVAGVGLWG